MTPPGTLTKHVVFEQHVQIHAIVSSLLSRIRTSNIRHFNDPETPDRLIDRPLRFFVCLDALMMARLPGRCCK